MTSNIYATVSVCLLLAAGGAYAGAVYKSTMPDGKVLYGNAPAPGAKKIEKMITNTQDAGVRIGTPEEKANVERRGAERQDEAARRQDEIEAARNALNQAEAELKAGKEPREGERSANARGGTRLNEEYFARQKQLEDNVAEARKRLEQVQQER